MRRHEHSSTALLIGTLTTQASYLAIFIDLTTHTIYITQLI